MNRFLQGTGKRLASYLTRPRYTADPAMITDPVLLRETLRPGDILLVEGTSRVSTAIKYLTQSTWSHVCLCVGDAYEDGGDDPRILIEADMVDGVIAIPVSRYTAFATRICRPVGLSEQDRQSVVDYALARIGHQYDLRNIVDLARYLWPLPPVPERYRRRMIEFGSGEPTRAICSSLIAEAFQQIRYPILPQRRETAEATVYSARHASHFMPRDFDLSPYFEVCKPTLSHGFSYTELQWRGDQSSSDQSSSSLSSRPQE